MSATYIHWLVRSIAKPRGWLIGPTVPTGLQHRATPIVIVVVGVMVAVEVAVAIGVWVEVAVAIGVWVEVVVEVAVKALLTQL